MSGVTLPLWRRRYVLGVRAALGATVMENFSKRTTAIIMVCFLLFGLGWGYGWQMVAEGSCPAVHCDYHSQHMICTPVGKAA